MDLIVSMKSIEIDGFGVLETYRHQGVGSTIQAYMVRWLKKPVILVADGEDTAARICILNKVIRFLVIGIKF